MIEGRKVIESCQCKLTPAEIKAKGEELARASRELIRIETEKKAAAASYKSLEETQRSSIAQVSLEITQGYVWRDLECTVILGTPEPGQKQIIRPDTNEVIRTANMTQDEMQAAFNFDDGKKPQ